MGGARRGYYAHALNPLLAHKTDMGKKKGGKGKKEKSEDGLPPPPDLESYKEGAREALLTFRQVKLLAWVPTPLATLLRGLL